MTEAEKQKYTDSFKKDLEIYKKWISEYEEKGYWTLENGEKCEEFVKLQNESLK